jgi:hypothetical protein
MPTPEYRGEPSAGAPAAPPVACSACRAALEDGDRRSLSFLLLDQLTIPVLGCEDHLDQFRSICGLTTEDEAELLDHVPAGGVRCPGCRNARYASAHPLIPVRDGGVVVTACPDHQSAIVERFEAGSRAREQLTASLDASLDSP